MPRYFLSVRRGDVLVPDPEGDEVPNVEAARRLAFEVARDILGNPHAYRGWDWRASEFVITDERGEQVAAVPFAAVLE